MEQADLETLARRVARLEAENLRLGRQQARWKLVAVAGLVGGGLLTFGGADDASVPDEVAARKFVLRDKFGNTRARLEIEKDGRVSFAMGDQKGQERFRVAMASQGPPLLEMIDQVGRNRFSLALDPLGPASIKLNAEDGRPRLGFYVNPSGWPELNLSDKEGRVRCSLSVLNNGSPAVELFDKQGKMRTSMALGPDDNPWVDVRDKLGQPRVSMLLRGNDLANLILLNPERNGGVALGSGATQPSSVVFADRKGVQRLMLSLDEAGDPLLNFSDAAGKNRLEAAASAAGGRITIQDPNGKPQFRAPGS